MRGLLIAFVASMILQLVLLFIISAMGRLFHICYLSQDASGSVDIAYSY